MKKQIIINYVLIGLLVLIILYLWFSREPKQVDYKPILYNLIESEKQKNKSDSIRLSNKVDSLAKRIKTINYLRKNEYIKFQQEISKFNRPFDSTMFVRVNDSIKKVCCSNDTN